MFVPLIPLFPDSESSNDGHIPVESAKWGNFRGCIPADHLDLVILGGDFSKPESREKTAAYSADEGNTWRLAEEQPAGYRSAVDTFDAGFVAVGPKGADTSRDGIHWVHIDSPALNALTFISGKGWAVGQKGLAAEFVDQTEYSTESAAP